MTAKAINDLLDEIAAWRCRRYELEAARARVAVQLLEQAEHALKDLRAQHYAKFLYRKEAR